MTSYVWTEIDLECPDCTGAVEVETRAELAPDLMQANDPARCTEDDCQRRGVQGDDDGVWLE
ncbi:MAG: hypothetical protein V3S01_00625 [Dehalococcoidia bacterium]